MLAKVAIYSKDSNQKTIEGVNDLIRGFCRRGIEIALYQKFPGSAECHRYEKAERFSDIHELKVLPDLVLSVGGDGTFLETVMKVRDFGIPIAGVNTGRMGFLANISREELDNSIEMLCRGEYGIMERSLLEIVSPVDLFGPRLSTALNDITIQKADPGMITIHVYVDDSFINTYWADGLIFSTATGSTAYNLSVGGPILSPEDESIIISPISPHNLTIRPIVISGESVLRMVMEGRSHEYMATCDSNSVRLPFTEEIRIRRSPFKLKTVMLKGTDFFGTLRNRLMWGADRRN